VSMHVLVVVFPHGSHSQANRLLLTQKAGQGCDLNQAGAVNKPQQRLDQYSVQFVATVHLRRLPRKGCSWTCLAVFMARSAGLLSLAHPACTAWCWWLPSPPTKWYVSGQD